MKKIFLVLVVMIAIGMAQAHASGSEESAGSSSRGIYLAGQGIVIPPDQVHVNSYIASVDYASEKPEGDVSVVLKTGNQQIPNSGGQTLVHIGIQAGEIVFNELPPMNLAFVIDKSGSMNSADKMGWVKDAFDVFIDRVRDVDFVSLVVFDSTARVVYPSTAMNSRDKRYRFRRAVQSVTADGGTNLVDGLRLGYQQVMANYRGEYTNRVLFLTDGVGESSGILAMARKYKEMGINVSTIGVGENFDLDLMVELAKTGGGSSRFISDREEMEEIFGSELDRMVVPAVTNLEMELSLPPGFEVLESWGYNHVINGNVIRFSQGTLHHRDYETILVRVETPPMEEEGVFEIARFTMSYDTSEGEGKQSARHGRRMVGPYILERLFVSDEVPTHGYSDAMVLRSGSMLHFAEKLIDIGSLYYSCRRELDRINVLRDALYKKTSAENEVAYESLSSPEIRELEGEVQRTMQSAMDETVSMRNELLNARLRLDDTGFDDEIAILDAYIDIMGRDMLLHDEIVNERADDTELRTVAVDRSLHDHVSNLFREMSLSMSSKDPGVIAVSGFTAKEERPSALLDLLNETAVMEVAKYDSLKVVERSDIDTLMEEQKLSLSSLVDTDTAIQIGNLLAADYILTGSLLEMPASVIVFGRIINTETGEIESVAQIILQKDSEITAML